MKSFRFPLLLGSAALLGTLGVSSCKDYLEVAPVALYTTEDAFSNVSGATSAVIGAYDLLSGDATYGTRLSTYYPYDTDEMPGAAGSATDDNGRRAISRYAAKASGNAEIANPFNGLYNGIERANLCIKYIPLMDQYDKGSAADTAALHRLYGEVLTLRAQYYFELIRNWGDVPASFVPSIDNKDLNLPNADRNATYDKLIDDLAVAQKLVPWRSNAGAASERITKGAVKAVRARLAMYRAGYQLRGFDMTRPADSKKYYEIARQECAELMAHRGEHTLNPKFEDVFRSINELRFDNSHEIIFEVAMGLSSAASDSKLGYVTGPILNNSGTFGTATGTIRVLPTYFYAFDSTDLRRDVTITAYTVEANNAQKGVKLNALTDGKFRRDWRVPVLNGSNNYLGYNWPIIRFADVLLMYAEAENELNGPTAAAKSALEEVRRRAYKPEFYKPLTGAAVGSKEEFFNTIVNQRALEFGGEGIRKYDLLRWNLLGAKITEARANLTKLKNGTDEYANIPTVMYYRVVNNALVWQRSFYRPAPATAPTGSPTAVAVDWRTAITDANISNVAEQYVTGKGKELLPFPQAAIDTDRNIQQNAGY
jgi:hypothetical protein